MEQIISMLANLKEDEGMPKNVKSKIEEAISVLRTEDIEKDIKANKILHLLEDISEDPSLPVHIRMQIWNLASSLEGI